MSSTNAANGTTTMTVCCCVMAATEKNNADLRLLVGNTMINARDDGLCTNCNADACPSDRGLALASWYMRCNPIIAESTPLPLSIRARLPARYVLLAAPPLPLSIRARLPARYVLVAAPPRPLSIRAPFPARYVLVASPPLPLLFIAHN